MNRFLLLILMVALTTTVRTLAQSVVESPVPEGLPKFKDTGNPERDAMDYDKLKREWYRQNGKEVSDSDYGFVNFEDSTKPEGCNLNFEVPAPLNQPSNLKGSWKLQDIKVIGGVDEKERIEAQQAIWHDLQMGSILELHDDHGTFLANTNVKNSYWMFDESAKRLTVSSYSECVCYIWDVVFELVHVSGNELEVIMNDSDEGSTIRYQLQYTKG